MQISSRGLGLIKQFEGLKLNAYKCPAGVLTVGFGHTGPDVKAGMVITEAQAETLLRQDVAKFERGVEKLAPKCTQGQFDALVSFAYNLGLGALGGSTLLKLHKAGSYQAAADQLLRWNKAGGRVLPGLTRRRAQERSLYLS